MSNKCFGTQYMHSSVASSYPHLLLFRLTHYNIRTYIGHSDGLTCIDINGTVAYTGVFSFTNLLFLKTLQISNYFILSLYSIPRSYCKGLFFIKKLRNDPTYKGSNYIKLPLNIPKIDALGCWNKFIIFWNFWK